jgi:bifunctional UDP-N-acetylglucosamine pyrophosphorylase/glucosamine-1-phosphate N-acetyltransferase
MLDPDQTYIDVTVELSRDVTLFPGTMLQGTTVVAAGCEIGPDTRLVDCVVGSGAMVENSVGRDSEVGDDAHVGPYAYLAPGTSVPSSASTGAFYTAPAD